MPKPIDLPPFWLLFSLALVWGLDALVPWGIFGPSGRTAGAAVAGIGVLLILGAAAQLAANRTTFIPKRTPSRIVTDGFFRFSRNPIYLGDALVLAGAILWWDVPHAVPVLVGFMALIQHRFILDEEARLRQDFRADFEVWSQQTGRWIGWGRRQT